MIDKQLEQVASDSETHTMETVREALERMALKFMEDRPLSRQFIDRYDSILALSQQYPQINAQPYRYAREYYHRRHGG